MENKIRLGILGTGRIVARVMTDMQNAKEIQITAIAGRSQEKAEAAAKTYGIPHAYGTLEAMADSDQVDLVYIALPHPAHARYACLMMDHGKHVLCEKPMAMNDTEVRQMVDCARKNNVFLMEAMWTRFLPAWRKMMEVIRAGEIGEIHHVVADFNYYLQTYDPKDRIFALELAGGALLDLGPYPLMACTALLGWNPEKVQGVCVKTKEGVDMRTSAQLLYPSQATAQFFCGMDARGNNFLQVYGTGGYIMMPDSWHPTSFTVYTKGNPEKTWNFPPENEGHHYEFDHAAECIRSGLRESPVVPLEESIAVAKICTQIRHENGIVYPGE